MGNPGDDEFGGDLLGGPESVVATGHHLPVEGCQLLLRYHVVSWEFIFFQYHFFALRKYMPNYEVKSIMK